jgi:hypothetical protein
MPPEEQIRAMFDRLPDEPLESGPGDTFKYGMLVGKAVAIGWVLGDSPRHDVMNDYDFEDWVLELRNRRGPIPPPENRSP